MCCWMDTHVNFLWDLNFYDQSYIIYLTVLQNKIWDGKLQRTSQLWMINLMPIYYFCGKYLFDHEYRVYDCMIPTRNTNKGEKREISIKIRYFAYSLQRWRRRNCWTVVRKKWKLSKLTCRFSSTVLFIHSCTHTQKY